MATRNLALKPPQQDEVIGLPPTWLMRYGILLILGIVLLLVLFASILKFPDTIKGKITITSSNPPATLIAPSSGKLVRIFVKDTQQVNKQDYLALLENSADFDEMMLLKQLIENQLGADSILLPNKQEKALVAKIKSSAVQLGELQSAFNVFQTAREKFEFYIKEKSQFKRIKALGNQLNDYTNLNHQLQDQAEDIQKKMNLAKKKMEHDETLAQEKVIAQADLDNSKKLYYDQLIQYKSNLASITQNKLAAEEINKKLIELQQESNFKRNDYYIDLENAINQLKSDFYKWEQHYVIKSPIAGKVSFFKFWSENQFVQTGEAVVSIVPAGQSILGKAYVTVMNSGKLKPGQEVKIRLENYPAVEFGLLTGKVSSISTVPQNNLLAVDVALVNGLTTTYHKTLPANQEMQGQAEIVIEDMRLIERIFYQFKNLFQNQ